MVKKNNFRVETGHNSFISLNVGGKLAAKVLKNLNKKINGQMGSLKLGK